MLPTYIATITTFLISGVWHGAGFTFIIWGLCHGIYSVVHAFYANWMRKKHKDFAINKSKAIIVLDILANYFVINIIQVFFRADSIGQAFYILKRMFIPESGIEQPYTWSFLAMVLLLGAILVVYKRFRKTGDINAYYPIMNLRSVKGLTVFFVFCGLSVILAYVGQTYFVYGAF